LLKEASPRTNRKFIIRCLINREVEDLVNTSRDSIATADVFTVTAVRRHAGKLVKHSPEMKSWTAALRKHLYAKFYRHPEVLRANDQACRRMETVFASLLADPSKLGTRSLARLAHEEPLPRIVADYVAGMTDRYIRDLSEELS
jgi:dGTPase